MTNPQPIAVVGAGSWGTALAILLTRNGQRTRLWGHKPEHVEQLRRTGENQHHLAGIAFPPGLEICSDVRAALADARDVLIAVPSHAFRATLVRLLPLPSATGVFWATKGLEPGTGNLLHRVATEVLGTAARIAVLSGPSFAREVAEHKPTAVTVASTHREDAERLAGRVRNERFRAYTSNDVIGVELAGALKNVLAIAAGIADGLSFGANARAALITRGLAEMTRLGRELGGRRETFTGLAGLGDLVLTCTDNQSRNRRMGLSLARGHSVRESLRAIGQAVEGVQTASVAAQLATDTGVEMPITEQTCRVLFERVPPLAAVDALFTREPKSEGF
jgi:glycerol-3-phosphate dehydrogenase (NAD(P)+)